MTNEAYLLVLYNKNSEVIFTDVWYAMKDKTDFKHVEIILDSLFPPYEGAYIDFIPDIEALMEIAYAGNVMRVTEDTANLVYDLLNNPEMNTNYVAPEKNVVMVSALLDNELQNGNLVEVYDFEASEFALDSPCFY